MFVYEHTKSLCVSRCSVVLKPKSLLCPGGNKGPPLLYGRVMNITVRFIIGIIVNVFFFFFFFFLDCY